MKNEITMGSNRNFGLVFSIVFLIIALYPLINNGSINFWSLIISCIFLVLGIFNSIILKPLNILWFKFGIVLGKLMSPIIMCLIFFFVVSPIGILLRIFGKDILNLKFNKKKSYWIKTNSEKLNMKDQF